MDVGNVFLCNKNRFKDEKHQNEEEKNIANEIKAKTSLKQTLKLEVFFLFQLSSNQS